MAVATTTVTVMVTVAVILPVTDRHTIIVKVLSMTIITAMIISPTILMTIPTIMLMTSTNKEGIHANRRKHIHERSFPSSNTTSHQRQRHTSPGHQKRRLSLSGAAVLHSHSQPSPVFFIARPLNLRQGATHPRRKKEHKNRILCVSK